MKETTDFLELQRQEVLLEEMGINRNEADKLRKTMMDHKDAVAAKEEELTRMRQHRGRKDDWEEWVDKKRRMGRVMHHSEFIRRLRTIVPKLMVTRAAVNGCISLYDIRNTPVREAPNYKGPEKWYFEMPIYIGWIGEGIMPEYEVDVVNDVGVPIGQWRGWRTILLRMITIWNHEHFLTSTAGVTELKFNLDVWGRKIRVSRGSIITEDQALQAFGYPTQGNTASAYRQQLYEFRNPLPLPLPPPDARY
jgi:hypothetical protein